MQHVVLHTSTPAPVTLATMGRTAREAADTFTFREWAARLATTARPRDYVGQLRALYKGILDRWRYVQEPGEWIHGSADSLIKHVLGTKYNAPANRDHRKLQLVDVPSTEKGWGDCDDVATVVAAGVLALGMQPSFRVARGDRGAHVSVLARTPTGETVSLDPVGHPTHPFGWSLQSNDVQIWDLDGQPTVALGSTEAMDQATVFSGFDGEPSGHSDATHWCAVPLGDVDGPRALAVPLKHWRMMRQGIVVDGMPAVDEHGKTYRYDAARDLWIDQRLHAGPLGNLGYLSGGLAGFGSSERRQRRKAGRRRRWKRFVQKVRRVVARVIGSPIAQKLVGGVLQMYGVPRRLTAGVMEAGSEILRKGGLIGFVRMLRKNPRAAARLVALAARKGARASMAGFGSIEDGSEGVVYQMTQNGRSFPVQPVAVLAGVPGMYELGELDISNVPTPGRYFRVSKGWNLLDTAEKAYGTKGGANVERSKWINNAAANAAYIDRKLKSAWYPNGRISFTTSFSCDPEAAQKGAKGNCYPVIYIPLLKGDEPAERAPTPAPGPVTFPELPPPPPAPPPAVVQEQPPLPAPGPMPVPDVVVKPPPGPIAPPVEPPTPTCGPGTVWDPFERRCVPFKVAPRAPDYVPLPSPPTEAPFMPRDLPTSRQAPKAPVDVTACPPGTVFNMRRMECVPRTPAPTTIPDLDPLPMPTLPPTMPPQPFTPPVATGPGGALPLLALLFMSGDLGL